MDYDKVKNTTLKVFQKCDIKSFPIDCIEILTKYGMKVETYYSQKPAKLSRCLTYSEDAFILKKTVYYNDNKPIGRIRFSLAHEIGHIALEHTVHRTEEQEKEADCFASYLLAPRMAIHYSICKNQNDVAKLFNISNEAAQYAFDDYRRWYRWTVYHKMSLFDKVMYTHFYNDNAKCFVYKIKKCACCDTVIYNSISIVCKKCNTPSRSYMWQPLPEDDFIIGENNWLYGGL
ncbi:MAG: hypothetical protein K0S76_1866 [Herbinix sp.]|jgi:Zn-dependent peptidase ImmA (M78 family)|nr:hypothetical protein [Herbinix sp.]